tara:strand:- start:4342 stop:4623 length:282 start_codon:yes stop_codon:yes gene_type:complete
MSNRFNVIRCHLCGRFIGDKDFTIDNVSINFTPDSYLTEEKIEHAHKTCGEKIFGHRRSELAKQMNEDGLTSKGILRAFMLPYVHPTQIKSKK